MSKRPVGHPLKTPCDRFRAASFYYATEWSAHQEFGGKITPAFLHRQFSSEGEQAKGTGPWYRYRDGKSLPGRGTYKNRKTNLVRDVGKRYPLVPPWLTKPLWALADAVEITLPELHSWMLALEPDVQHKLISQLDTNTYCRWYSNTQFLIEGMIKHGSLDALAGAIAVLREADLHQSLESHNIAFEGICALLPCLEKEPATAPFADKFSTYAKRLFEPMWALIPGLYHQHPSQVHASYRGVLCIPKEAS